MKKKSNIRVIKKDEPPAPAAAPSTSSMGRQARQEVRDLSDTVNTWVDEFQQRRDDENFRALRELFPIG
ncbi:MAG: hypothetical protein ABIP75_05975 [Pyrinomonadaceae bacterium]